MLNVVGDALERVGAAQADDVDPHHGPLVHELVELLHRDVRLLDDAILVVGDHVDRRRQRVGRDVHRARLGARRGAATDPRLESTAFAMVAHGGDCSTPAVAASGNLPGDLDAFLMRRRPSLEPYLTRPS